MNKGILITGVLAVLTSACVALNNPFRNETVFVQDACGFDFHQPVELQRLRFQPPTFWSRLSPCEAVRISLNTYRDGWSVGAKSAYREGTVVALSEVAGFGIGSNAHFIGNPFHTKTPQEWLAWRRAGWEERAKYDRPSKRKVTRVHRRALDCWRIETQSFLEKPGTRDDYEQSHFGISYTCWVPGNKKYPPIGMSAGVAYHQGEPVYDVDVDKVLLLPVLKTVEVKQLSAEDYAERVAAYRERFEARCKRHVARAWRTGIPNLDDDDRKSLRDCGYDPSTLRPRAP